MSQTQIALISFSVVTALFSGYCFGRAHEIKSGDKAAERWYQAYLEVLARLK